MLYLENIIYKNISVRLGFRNYFVLKGDLMLIIKYIFLFTLAFYWVAAADGFQDMNEKIILAQLGNTYPNLSVKNNHFDSLEHLSPNSRHISSKNNISNGNVIDEKSYYIGGGDEFTIMMVDRPTLNYKGSVDQRGQLFLSGLGLIKLGKITLSEAKERIKETLLLKNKNSDIYIKLTKCKDVCVDISGYVDEPGRYVFPGAVRILDALRIANKGKELLIAESDLRQVRCMTKDTIFYYDILKYTNNGDLSQNPYIFPGDNILLEPVTRQVLLTGAVKRNTDWIPIKTDEKLKDFLSLFRLDASADSGKIIIQTSDENSNRKILHLDLDKDSEYTLKDQDLVIIPRKKNYNEVYYVSVGGEIQKPGVYPIIKSRTLAEDVLDMAGNITEFGDKDRAVVIRSAKMLSEKVNFTSVRPELGSSLQKSSAANDYTLFLLKENPELILENNDRIFIPKIEKHVYVSGEVKRAGGIEYKPDAKKEYYIKQAGGYSRKADKSNIYVITKYSDVFQTSDGENIKQGDIIVVPVSQQNRVFTTIVVPLVSVISTTLVVLLSAYNTIQSK